MAIPEDQESQKADAELTVSGQEVVVQGSSRSGCSYVSDARWITSLLSQPIRSPRSVGINGIERRESDSFARDHRDSANLPNI